MNFQLLRCSAKEFCENGHISVPNLNIETVKDRNSRLGFCNLSKWVFCSFLSVFPIFSMATFINRVKF